MTRYLLLTLTVKGEKFVKLSGKRKIVQPGKTERLLVTQTKQLFITEGKSGKVLLSLGF